MKTTNLNIKSNLIKKAEFENLTLYIEETNGDKFKYVGVDAAGAVALRDSKNPDEHYVQFIRDNNFYTKIRSNNPTW